MLPAWQLCSRLGLIFVVSSALNSQDFACPECEHFDGDQTLGRKRHIFGASSDTQSACASVQNFVVDSGATLHCINDPSLFETIYYDHPAVTLTVANAQRITALAVGSVRLKLLGSDGNYHDFLIHNVVYHPTFPTNLLSVRQMWKQHRLKCVFQGRSRFKCKHTGTYFTFSFSHEYKIRNFVNRVSRVIDSDVIHARFGHTRARLRGFVTASETYQID